MAETHVVSALKEKRIQLATQIEKLKGQLHKTVIDLDHVEATLRLYDPEIQMTDLGARKVPQVLSDIHGETGRVILDTLRTATAPMTTNAINEAVMKARGLDTDDKGLCRLMMKRTFANLKYWHRKRGLVRPMPGPGQQHAWELVR